jgi:hypothetical protein
MLPPVATHEPRAGSPIRLTVLLLLGAGTGAGVTSCGPRNIPRPMDAGPVPADVVKRDVPFDVAAPPRDVAAPETGPPDGPPTICGGDGQVCCPGNQCLANGCCVSGRCVTAFTTCAVGSTCVNGGSCGGCGGPPMGAVSQRCCEMRSCTASKTVCVGLGVGQCTFCGGGGQPCCADGYCDSGFVCGATGNCLSCGLDSQPCCADQQCSGGGCCSGNACAPNGGTCALGGGFCATGACATCGTDGKRCCPGQDVGKACGGANTVCAAPSASGADPVCTACGDTAQPCCANGRCKEDRACNTNAGSCEPCGATGQLCCAGDICGAGGCCISGSCLANGTPCGAPVGACTGGKCAGCGDMNQPCCPTAASVDRTACKQGLMCDNMVCLLK